MNGLAVFLLRGAGVEKALEDTYAISELFQYEAWTVMRTSTALQGYKHSSLIKSPCTLFITLVILLIEQLLQLLSKVPVYCCMMTLAGP
jgi:hypothetical protein